MIEEDAPAGGELQATGNSTIPPVYTYWGQFIDHDITLNTDNNKGIADVTQRRPEADPAAPTVVAGLRNGRQPALNLDSVYGDGPTFPGGPPTEAANMYDGHQSCSSPTVTSAGRPATRSLPRTTSNATCSGARSSTDGASSATAATTRTSIVAQLHVAFVRFHNAVLDVVRDAPGDPLDDRALFARVRQLVSWHYQWLVVHDYLKTVTQTGVVDKVLLGGNKVFTERNGGVVHAAGVLRRGVPLRAHDGPRLLRLQPQLRPQGERRLRRGSRRSRRSRRCSPSPDRRATRTACQRRSTAARNTTLPGNWVIEWDRFVDKGAVRPDHFARRIDTQLAPPLFDMLNQVDNSDRAHPVPVDIQELLTRARDAQSAARLLAVPADGPGGRRGARDRRRSARTSCTRATPRRFNQVLDAGGFQTKTPLWYYVLKEAEVKANGNSLGPVGSRIVAETMIGQMRQDADSFLNAPGGWSPEQGVKIDGEPIVSINDLFRFAGVA